MNREDTKPWYRQFWPWFIIALPSAAVVGGLTTVWISLQTTDSLVVQSDDGMQIVAERRVIAEQLAAELNLAAALDIDLESGAILAAIRSGDLESVPNVLELEFSHPAFANRDQQITLNSAPPDEAGNPVWSGHFVSIPDGRWYVTLTSDDDWRLAGEWQGESQITLRPAESSDADER
ncbi:MAG: FixH family protein [Woeseiaceae bacterium]